MNSILASHATSWHDGGVAVLGPDDQLVALASERVGDRYKHSWNSKLAYEHLRQHLPAEYFSSIDDHFIDNSQGLQGDGHHFYHACSAYYGSGFDDAAVLVVDGQGPAGSHVSTTTIWHGTSHKLGLVADINKSRTSFAAQSIGHFYTAVTALAGFNNLFCEGKSMALAAYGRPSPYLELFSEYMDVGPDGTPVIDPLLTTSILAHTLGPALFNWGEPTAAQAALWRRLLEMRAGDTGDSWPTQDDMNIAYAGQVILEKLMLGLARLAKTNTGSSRLCLAGGVALNCIANGRILRSGLFEDVYVPPAPADEGQAIGKLYALAVEQGRTCPPTETSYLGPPYSPADIDSALAERRDRVQSVRLPSTATRISEAVRLLVEGKIIGWFQGRSELGPRALGHRSILADPRDSQMRDRLNRVKEREWFRPVAPVVTEDAAARFFAVAQPCPFMSFGAYVHPECRNRIPSATHVDGTARVQTVNKRQDPTLHQLLTSFEQKSGLPVLLNTSFNGKNEPIVETPADAIESFLSLHLDHLFLEDRLVQRLNRN